MSVLKALITAMLTATVLTPLEASSVHAVWATPAMVLKIAQVRKLIVLIACNSSNDCFVYVTFHFQTSMSVLLGRTLVTSMQSVRTSLAAMTVSVWMATWRMQPSA